MKCSICETEVSERALFCEVCGNRVRREAPQPARVATATRSSSTATAPRVAPPATAQPPLPREELAAAIATRMELGERMEPEVLDAFLARIESAVVTRVDERVEAHLRGPVQRRRREKQSREVGLPVAICSLVFGIPLSAIAAGTTGLAGLIVAWAGIAAVNIAVNAGNAAASGTKER